MGASPEELWDNAKHRWSIGARPRAVLKELAEQGTPAFLIAVGTKVGPYSGIVQLVEEIVDVTYDGPRPNGDGWRFQRSEYEGNPRRRAAHKLFMGKRLGQQANVGVVYSEALRALL